MIHLGHLSCQKDLRFEASVSQRLGMMEFKVVRENSGYCVQCTFPIHLPFYKFFERSVEPCHWQVTPLIKFEIMPIYLEFSFILFAKFLLFFMAILEAKSFLKNFSMSFEKSKQQTHSL